MSEEQTSAWVDCQVLTGDVYRCMVGVRAGEAQLHSQVPRKAKCGVAGRQQLDTLAEDWRGLAWCGPGWHSFAERTAVDADWPLATGLPAGAARWLAGAGQAPRLMWRYPIYGTRSAARSLVTVPPTSVDPPRLAFEGRWLIARCL